MIVLRVPAKLIELLITRSLIPVSLRVLIADLRVECIEDYSEASKTITVTAASKRHCSRHDESTVIDGGSETLRVASAC